jgi:hypothetical protein
MDTDIKRPDPLPDRKTELMGARETIVSMYLFRFFQAFNAEMEMAYKDMQTADELNHALDVLNNIYSERIIKALYK